MKIVTDENAGGLPAVDFWARADSRSLINLVPTAVQNAFLAASKQRPELFGLDERSLYRQLRQEGLSPTPTDNRLRIKFWTEYDRAQADMGSIDVSGVVGGICHRQFFYEKYLAAPEKVAWMCTPPASYENVMEEALQFGIEQLRDILELPHTKSDGSLDTKSGELKAKIVAMLDQRVKGAVLQKTMNLHASVTGKQAKQISGAGELMTMDDIEKRMKELEKRKRQAQHLNDVPKDPE